MSILDSPPFGHGAPPARGLLRVTADDFQVDEDLGFEPSGDGEHVLLQIRKRDANTDWVAKRIVRLADVKSMAVSFAGLKDRRAVATQWFSVQLPGRQEPDWAALNDDQIEVLSSARHHRKLRRGALRGNCFTLVVRHLEGDVEAVEQRLSAIGAQGVPAYFGEQRFGREGGNVERAREMFAGRRVPRHQRSLLLSSVRSWLFNRVLAVRVDRGDWNHLLAGDVAMLDGSHSVFAVPELDGDLRARCERMDLHPTGPLWGRGDLATCGEVLALEQDALAGDEDLCRGLEAAGLEQQRRALRQPVRELRWQWLDPTALKLTFFLERGCYATSVMRELLGDDTSPADVTNA